MSEISVDQQTFASGRYSKRKRTQVTYYMDELDVSDSESDFEGVQVKKRKATVSKPLPKSKVFPFLQLPAEIRNIIYGYTLADASGIHLVGTFKHKRRTVERISAETQSHIRRSRHYYANYKINDAMQAKSEEPVALVPSLLSVCKQIYQEGCDILYGNEFIFTNSFALYSFLLNLGPVGSKHLKHLRIMGWSYSRTMKGYNHSCFAVLVWATNLETLCLDNTPGYHRNANGMASQLYRDAFPWFEAVGAAKGKIDAGVHILQIASDAFNRCSFAPNQQAVSAQELRNQLLEELTKLLCAQHKRLTAAPLKKKKVVKKVAADEL